MSWLARLTPGLAGMLFAAIAVAQGGSAQVEKGRQVYEYWCATCHGPGIGTFGFANLPGTMALQAKYKGSVPALLTERTDMNPGFVKLFVRQGITIMPFFRKTEISDTDLDAIAAYLTRNNK